MEQLKTFLTSSKVKTFYWQTANGLVLLLITYIAEVDWQYAVVAMPILNAITKWINQNYL